MTTLVHWTYPAFFHHFLDRMMDARSLSIVLLLPTTAMANHSRQPQPDESTSAALHRCGPHWSNSVMVVNTGGVIILLLLLLLLPVTSSHPWPRWTRANRPLHLHHNKPLRPLYLAACQWIPRQSHPGRQSDGCHHHHHHHHSFIVLYVVYVRFDSINHYVLTNELRTRIYSHTHTHTQVQQHCVKQLCVPCVCMQHCVDYKLWKNTS